MSLLTMTLDAYIAKFPGVAVTLLIDIAIAVAYFIVSYLLLSKKINPLKIIDRLKEKKK